jgi:signal transduction histidine kinase
MDEALGFLGAKFDAAIVFAHDLRQAALPSDIPLLRHCSASPQLLVALEAAFARGVPVLTLQHGEEFGLPMNTLLMCFGLPAHGELPAVRGGLHLTMRESPCSAPMLFELAADARIFLENWIVAHSTMRLQQQVAAERMLREKMYVERLESIAYMVTSMAHEINTPLGIATASNSMIQQLVKQLRAAESTEVETLDADLAEACALLSKNVLRAHSLIKSLKQLSVEQLSDRREVVELSSVVRDCIDSMLPELRLKKIEVTSTTTPGEDVTWNGFPGHFSQVLINLFQNCLRYAYSDGQGGKIDVLIRRIVDSQGTFLRVAVRDYGPGIAPAVRKRLFQPFVTTGIGQGGTGLGLAIVHNIIVNVLKGRIQLEDPEGGGTCFVVELPAVVPPVDGEDGYQMRGQNAVQVGIEELDVLQEVGCR